jgi:hypothetical protein
MLHHNVLPSATLRRCRLFRRAVLPLCVAAVLRSCSLAAVPCRHAAAAAAATTVLVLVYYYCYYTTMLLLHHLLVGHLRLITGHLQFEEGHFLRLE